jgi:hypothetical protein
MDCGISQNSLPFAEEKFSCVIEFGVIHKVALSLGLGPAFTPYPLFEWYLQSNEI